MPSGSRVTTIITNTEVLMPPVKGSSPSPLTFPYSGVCESRKLFPCTAYDSDTGSEISSDGSVVMSTMPKMRGYTTIDADVGLYTSVGFRKFMAPEIATDNKRTLFVEKDNEIEIDTGIEHTLFSEDDSKINPDFGDFFDRHSADPKKKIQRVLSRWSFLFENTLKNDNIDKFNAVVRANMWVRLAKAIVKLDNQKASPTSNKPGLLKKGMQVVSTGAGLSLGAAATTVQTGWSFGKAVVGAVVGLGKKPDQTRAQPTRKHTRFDESGDEEVVEEVVVRSENQMQADLRAENDREIVSSTGGMANGAPNASTPTPPPANGASKAPTPPAPPANGARKAPTPPPPPANGAPNAPTPQSASDKPATLSSMFDELQKRTASVRKKADEESENRDKFVAAEEARLAEAKRIADENRLYSLDFLQMMPWRQKNGEGWSVQKLYMAHMNTKDANGDPHFPEGTANRSKDALVPDLLTLTKDQKIDFPW